MADTDVISNGFNFGECYLAKEVIGHIFSFADVPTLAKLRLVCRSWRSVVEDPLLWKKKCLMEGKYWPKIVVDPSLPWAAYADIYLKQPFERNLIHNPCGADGLAYWRVLNEWKNAGFTIENPPVGSNCVPDEVANSSGFQNSCFATSYNICAKEQIVDLKLAGIPEKILNAHKPSIFISEWYAGRSDCSCLYRLKICLLNEKFQILATQSFVANIRQREGNEWHKVEKVFRNYPVGVRYVKFYHEGVNTQFRNGHFGSKFTAASVTIRFDS